MIKRMNGKKGFTMVEVIVVAVIVGVLATVGIVLYNSYVGQARKNTAENLAASAATYLQTVRSTLGDAGISALDPSPAAGLTGGRSWNANMPDPTPDILFTCPRNAQIIPGGDVENRPTIRVMIGSDTSAAYAY